MNETTPPLPTLLCACCKADFIPTLIEKELGAPIPLCNACALREIHRLRQWFELILAGTAPGNEMPNACGQIQAWVTDITRGMCAMTALRALIETTGWLPKPRIIEGREVGFIPDVRPDCECDGRCEAHTETVPQGSTQTGNAEPAQPPGQPENAG